MIVWYYPVRVPLSEHGGLEDDAASCEESSEATRPAIAICEQEQPQGEIREINTYVDQAAAHRRRPYTW